MRFLKRLWRKIQKRRKGRVKLLTHRLVFRWSFQLFDKYPYVVQIPFKFEIKCDTAANEDHTPKLSVYLVVRGWNVLDLDIENIYHGRYCPPACCSR